MKQLLILLGLCAGAWVFGSCARDVNTGLEEDPYPQEVRLTYSTRGAFSSDVWYYFVFNYTASPSISLDTAPIDNVSDETRGRNWERYIVLHRDAGQDSLYTLQRPRVPTVLRTSRGPTDIAVGDFNGDTIDDIAVACLRGNVVDWFEGVAADAYDTTYFEDVQQLTTGDQAMFVQTENYNADAFLDLMTIFAGADGNSPLLRVMLGAADNAFTFLADQPLEALTLIDYAYADINNDSNFDLLLLGTVPGTTNGALQVLLGEGDGTYTAGTTVSVGESPVALAVGELGPAPGEEASMNFKEVAVALAGDATASSVAVRFGDGTGEFSVGPLLTVAGSLTGVAIDQMQGTRNDVVVSYTAESVGYIASFLSEESEPLTDDTTPVIAQMEGQPRALGVVDTTDDNHPDAVIVEGAPGSNVRNLFIRNGLVELNSETQVQEFVWGDDSVVYVSASEPRRIIFGDVDANTFVDMLVPNFADDENGNSISIYYGLGNDNFTSADIYWTDQSPELLTGQDWYISHTVGRNFFDLTINPALFYDLAEREPENFLVDFMTATTGIALEHNLDRLGEVGDNLSRPLVVPMQIGHLDDEQITPLANATISPIDSEDIELWRVEVN